jgi:azurin
MVCEVRRGGSYGYLGTKDSQPPDLPFVYLPRGLDNSSGAQVEVTSDRWGPLVGQLIHFSFGAGSQFLLLREHVDGQPQGAAVPLPGDFLSGVHRGRFNPKDGQLYVTGMAGWGTYTSEDGCFQRVRYTGDPVQLPIALHIHENGVLVSFSRLLDREIAEKIGNQFVQAWNYRYSQGYGSPELSPRHPGLPGHDPLAVHSAHVLADGKSLFLEILEIQPVNQLHLHLRVDAGPPQDLYATVHKLAAPFTGFPGYRPRSKTIAAHPILADMVALNVPKAPNPWQRSLRGAREIHLAAGPNLSYSVTAFTVRPGEPIKLTFSNPDVVPHNWALARPGTLSKVGDLVNKIIAEPDGVARHYIPQTKDILVYTDIVEPGTDFAISFRAPLQRGRYPYLCTFPGHWMVMNGVMTVE